MLVGKRMRRDVITVSPEEGVRSAMKLIREERIRHLPVTEGRRLVGIITDRDLRRVAPSPATSLSVFELNYLLDKLAVKEVMTKDVIWVTPETTIEEAAKLLHDRKIGGLPVVDERHEVVGIITETDILEAFVEVMGLGLPQSRLELVLEDKPGAFQQVCRVIEEFDGDISSIVTARATHQGQERKVLIIRLEVADMDGAVKRLERDGFPVLSVNA
jgi:acetoin utilization protein AcuB